MNQGQLFYLMGASGAGKDSLIEYACQHLDDPARFRFVRRRITRPPDPEKLNHDEYITPDEFKNQLKNGNFALNWKRHKICYGITAEINTWLKTGIHVVINGSRHHYPIALKTYPDLYAIWITASPSILQQRLQDRGRESKNEISERMQTANQFNPPAADSGNKFLVIDNNGPLTNAGEEFLKVLQT